MEKEEQEGPLDPLVKRSRSLRSLRESRESLETSLKEKKEEIKLEETNYNTEEEKLREDIRSGRTSLGSGLRDHIFLANSGILNSNEDIQEVLEKKSKEGQRLLDIMGMSKLFWHSNSDYSVNHPRGCSSNLHIYSLSDPAYTINGENLILTPRSVTRLLIRPVFEDDLMWVFQEDAEPEEVNVNLHLGGYHSSNPNLNDSSVTFKGLDNNFSRIPTAQVLIRQLLGLDIEEDLARASREYTHKVATKAAIALRSTFSELLHLDKKIATINERYNPSGNRESRKDEMFHVKPQAPSGESDPFFAAIMSSDSRGERRWALEHLSDHMTCLYRSGLINYSEPLEVQEEPGVKRVYDLSSIARHIRDVLEISFSKEGVANLT